MTIGLIIPVLNEAGAIAQTLRHSAWLGFDELIVADGGSTDGTPDLVKTSMARTASESPPGATANPFAVCTPPTLLSALPGRGRQMNAGALLSRSDVLVFLHADTQLPTDARRAIEEALQSSNCVGGRFDVCFDRNTALGTVVSRMMNWRSRLTGIATGDQVIFVRRTAFEALGGFAEIPIMEDVDFSKRLKRLGTVEPLRSKVTTSYRRWSSCGPVRTILLMWGLRLLFWVGVSPNRLKRWYRDAR